MTDKTENVPEWVGPEWDFHSVMVTWRLWAIGYYDGGDLNHFWRTFALGPLRFIFLRLKTVEQRSAYLARKDSQ